mgnify:CR=1 FL=1
MIFVVLLFCATIALYTLNKLSYVILKERSFSKEKWDLNICCGKTDGGGLNVDIANHCQSLRNFKLINDIYNLPFASRQFEKVMCSHTIEHVDNPAAFDRELRRVGAHVKYIIPPLWDIAAAFNFYEHKWIFITFKKEHESLPPYIRLPFTRTLHKYFEQRITA